MQTEGIAEPEAEVRSWQKFLDNAVHDLRSALRSIRAGADILAGTCPDSASRDVIGIMLGGVDRIETLSTRLSCYSRSLVAESGEPILVSVETALHSVTDELQTLIRDTDTTITSAPLPRIYGSHQLLATLFRELLANAIQYRSTAPPKIEITVLNLEEQWQFRVKDNGQGIDAKFSQTVFLPFQRLHAGSKNSGLGLAICRKILGLHGGTIWLESEPGNGSTFIFTLPISTLTARE